MDKRKGRFVLDGKKTMRLGTEVYKEIVEKMLSVHIAHMERKMRCCLQCAPVCAPVAGRPPRRKPYTSQYKGKKFLPQHMLPTYLINKLQNAQRHNARDGNNLPLPARTEFNIRRGFEEKEQELRRFNGDAEAADQYRLNLADQRRIRRLRADRSQFVPQQWDMRDRSLWDDTSATIPDVRPVLLDAPSNILNVEAGLPGFAGPVAGQQPVIPVARSRQPSLQRQVSTLLGARAQAPYSRNQYRVNLAGPVGQQPVIPAVRSRETSLQRRVTALLEDPSNVLDFEGGLPVFTGPRVPGVAPIEADFREASLDPITCPEDPRVQVYSPTPSRSRSRAPSRSFSLSRSREPRASSSSRAPSSSRESSPASSPPASPGGPEIVDNTTYSQRAAEIDEAERDEADRIAQLEVGDRERRESQQNLSAAAAFLAQVDFENELRRAQAAELAGEGDGGDGDQKQEDKPPDSPQIPPTPIVRHQPVLVAPTPVHATDIADGDASGFVAPLVPFSLGSESDQDDEEKEGSPGDIKRQELAEILAKHLADENEIDAGNRVKQRRGYSRSYNKFWTKNMAAWSTNDVDDYGDLPDWVEDSLFKAHGAGTFRKELAGALIRGNTKTEGYDNWYAHVMQVLGDPKFNRLFGEEEAMPAPPPMSPVSRRLRPRKKRPQTPRHDLSSDKVQATLVAEPLRVIPKWERYEKVFQINHVNQTGEIEWGGLTTAHMDEVRTAIAAALPTNDANFNERYYDYLSQFPNDLDKIEEASPAEIAAGHGNHVHDSASFQQWCTEQTKIVATRPNEHPLSIVGGAKLAWEVPTWLIEPLGKHWIDVRVRRDPVFDEVLCPVWKDSVNQAGRAIICWGTWINVRCDIEGQNGPVSIPYEYLFKRGAPSVGSRDHHDPDGPDGPDPGPGPGPGSPPGSPGRSRTPMRSLSRSPPMSPMREVSVSRHRPQHRPSEQQLREEATDILNRTASNPNKPHASDNWFPDDAVAAKTYVKLWHQSMPRTQEPDADTNPVSIVRCIEYVWLKMEEGQPADAPAAILEVKRIFRTYHRLFLQALAEQRSPDVRRWRTTTAHSIASALDTPEKRQHAGDAIGRGTALAQPIKIVMDAAMANHDPPTIRHLMKRFLNAIKRRRDRNESTDTPALAHLLTKQMTRYGITETETTPDFLGRVWAEMGRKFDPQEPDPPELDLTDDESLFGRRRNASAEPEITREHSRARVQSPGLPSVPLRRPRAEE